MDRKLAEAMEEQREIDKRKNNLIIVNMKESTRVEIEERKYDDLTAARTLFERVVSLDQGDVVEPVRLGRMGGNLPRMLRVTVKSEEKKKEILRKAHELNSSVTDSKKKVYINSDYTQKQRETYKALRAEKHRRTEEGEQNLVIRNGKIVVGKPRQEGKSLHGTPGSTDTTRGERESRE